MSFNDRLNATIAARGNLCVGLDPIYSELPEEAQAGGDVRAALLAFNRRVAEAAAPYASAFKLQLKVYSAEGAEGVAALIESCRYLKATYPDHILVLDAKYGDVGHVMSRSAHEAFELCGADVLTAFAHTGYEGIGPLLADPERGVFVVCRTSNPGAAEMQDVTVVGGDPYFLHLARLANGWNRLGNCGLVAGATYPAEMAAIREAAPDLPLLVPGVGAQGGDLRGSILAGSDKNGTGLLLAVSRGIMSAADPQAAAASYKQQIDAARQELGAADRSTSGELARLLIDLFDAGIIRFERITLKSGRISPYYHNLRSLSSHPDLLRRVASQFVARAKELNLAYDSVLGIAYAGIPLAIATGVIGGTPSGYIRAEAKAYGTKQMVEGAKAGDRALLIDDVISDGASKLEVLGTLRAANIAVSDILVFVDRGQGGFDILRNAGLHPHAVTTMDETLRVLRGAGRIDDTQVAESQAFMRGEAI